MFSGTKMCSADTTNMHSKIVKIIDTPGYFDGNTSVKANVGGISAALSLAKDGINAIALVIDGSKRFTEQDGRIIYELLRYDGIQPYLFVLFTHIGDNENTRKQQINLFIKP